MGRHKKDSVAEVEDSYEDLPGHGRLEGEHAGPGADGTFHIADIMTVLSGRPLSLDGVAGATAILGFILGNVPDNTEIMRRFTEIQAAVAKAFPQLVPEIDRLPKHDKKVELNQHMRGLARKYGKRHAPPRLSTPEQIRAMIDSEGSQNRTMEKRVKAMKPVQPIRLTYLY